MSLSDLKARLQPLIARDELAGLVALTYRGGELVQELALGWLDVDRRIPMRRDAIFRIASQTKPIVSVAAMMLVEEGRLRLDDAVTRWLPELEGRRVLRRADGPIDDTVAAVRDITLEDLLTHRAGLDYGMFSTGPVAEAYRLALGGIEGFAAGPDAWMAALGGLPLVYQPGERMHYSYATDALGVLVARVANQSLQDFLTERVFAPLGMVDTGFSVPAVKRTRVAGLYAYDDTAGWLVEVDMAVPTETPLFPSGGAGLFSTADDYLAFARMLLAEGEAGGQHLLKPETVRAMLTNRLTPQQRTITFIGAPTWQGVGFGLGLAVVDDPERNLLGIGRAGSFTWPGAFGTWWQVDPVEGIIMIYMIQHFIDLNANMGESIMSARGAGRLALPIYQQTTYNTMLGWSGGSR